MITLLIIGALLLVLTGHGLLLIGIVAGLVGVLALLRVLLCGGGGSW